MVCEKQNLDPDRTLAGKPSIINVNLSEAGKEYPHMLPAGCRKFTIKMRDGTAFRLSFLHDVVAESNPGYLTVGTNRTYWEDNLNIIEDTWVYFACSSANKVVEVVQWT